VYLDQVNQVRLHIVQIGEEVLPAAANELSRQEILSAKTQELIEHMRDTIHNAPGVGLAGVPYVDRMRTSTFATLENLERFLEGPANLRHSCQTKVRPR
jgi:peptide deformylase